MHQENNRMSMFRTLEGTTLTACRIKNDDLAQSQYFVNLVIACDATVENTYSPGASFAGIRFAPTGGSLAFDDVNLTNTNWDRADTSNVIFKNVNLTGSNITLQQLATAYIDDSSRLPKGITLQ